MTPEPIQRPTVGVVIPTFRRPVLLAQALRSVEAQTLRPTRTIVVDDACGDGGDVAAIGSAAGVEVIPGPGSGVSLARNAGAGCLGTDFLAFLDDDDLWHEDFLETALAAAESRDADAVFLGAEFLDGSRTPRRVLRPRPTEDFLDDVARNPGVTGSTMLVRRAAFEAVGGFDPELFVSNDKDLAYRLAASCRIATMAEPRVTIRAHGSPRLTLQHRPRRLASLERYARKHGAHATPRARARMQLSVLRERWHLQRSPGDRAATVVTALGLLWRAGAFDVIGQRLHGLVPRLRASMADRIAGVEPVSLGDPALPAHEDDAGRGLRRR